MMFARTLFFLFASLLFASAANAATAPNYAIPILDIEGDTIASAALLSPTQALTAAHAVDGLHQPVFMRCSKDLMFGLVTKFDEAADLATIETFTPCNTVTALTIAKDNPEEGTRIIIQGYPAGGPRRVTSGLVSGYDNIVFETHSFKGRPVMISDALIAGGNSGGPAVANNILIGIVQAKICYDTPKGVVPACYSILAPPSAINKFLSQG